MSCTVCSNFCGFTMEQRISHAKSHHGFPKCTLCPRVFKSVTVFNKHLLKQHETKKCNFVKCEELVVCGNELQHAIVAHGFPFCLVCGETVESSWPNFFRHLNAHETEATQDCLCCDATIPAWMARSHATTVHGYPTCPVCEEITTSNHGNFMTHLFSHEVEAPCPRCPDNVMVKQKNQRSHAVECHAFPQCSMCSTTFESIPMFYNHVRRCKVSESDDSDDERDCPLCDESICTDKPMLLQHFVNRHEFTAFECPRCFTGRGSDNMTCLSFLRHVANCFNGRNYDCDECHKTFSSRHRLVEHECIPIGTTMASFETCARMLHGKDDEFQLDTLNVRVTWDLAGYANVPALPPPATFTPATTFPESDEEKQRRKHKLDEDSRIFIEDVKTVPWMYRFMGLPSELGDSLMPDMKLALVKVLEARPGRDLWLYLVYRFSRYCEDIHDILRVATLPSGTDEKYRQLEQLSIFNAELEKYARRLVRKVEFKTRQSTTRPLGKQLKALERAKRTGTDLPVDYLGAVKPSTRPVFVLPDRHRPPLLTAAEKEVNFDDLLNSGEISNTYTMPEPSEAVDWDVSFWRTIYLVFRDFLTYAVMSKTCPSLRLFANFVNDDPTWQDVEFFLTSFKPFLDIDKSSPSSNISARAVALERELIREIKLSKTMLKMGSSVGELNCRQLIAFDKVTENFKKQKLHRS